MYKKYVKLLNKLLNARNYATRVKKSVILQDTEKIPVIKYPLSKAEDRRVYVWGLAETGALGVHKSIKKQSKKYAEYIQHPSRLQFAETLDVVDVACGYGFSAFAVKRSDSISLFGTGLNTDSQIGFHKHGGVTNKPMNILIYPAPIQLPETIVGEKIQIKLCSAGRAHLLALSEDGMVFSLGNNSYGQCGRPIVENEKYSANLLVHQIPHVGPETDDRIKHIHCGQDHSIFLTESGKLYSCGWGADGQTGLGHYGNCDKPTFVGGDISTETIVKVAGTVDSVLALNDKGEVFGWGNAEYGQIDVVGDVQQINTPSFLKFTKGLGRIVDIAAGGSYSLILNENGDLFIWGYGILGLGPQVEYIRRPTQIPPTLFGRNDFNPNSRVVAISSGISHMGAINDQNDAFMWGRNKFGCLGLGHVSDQYFPFKAAIGAKVMKLCCGVDHTVALCKPFI